MLYFTTMLYSSWVPKKKDPLHFPWREFYRSKFALWASWLFAYPTIELPCNLEGNYDLWPGWAMQPTTCMGGATYNFIPKAPINLLPQDYEDVRTIARSRASICFPLRKCCQVWYSAAMGETRGSSSFNRCMHSRAFGTRFSLFCEIWFEREVSLV